MRVLQIGADRSRRGILTPGSTAYLRQSAYAERFGALDVVGFSLEDDDFTEQSDGALHTFPTKSRSRLLFGLDAIFLASRLPWPDVVSVQDPFETGLAGYFIARFSNSSLHVQVHTDFLSPAYLRHSILNRLRVWIAGFVLRRAARIRVVSHRIKISIETQYRLSAPISVLPIYVDLDRIRSAVASIELTQKFDRFHKKLLYVGRLEPEKHPCLALESFAAAAPENTCLILVGSGSEEEHLQRLAKELGIADRVFFEGEKDALPYFSLADLVLVTSRYEGYGLVIIEALAAHKPVLSTDVGVAKEVGATVTTEKEYTGALRKWFTHGPYSGALTSYPYSSAEQYVEAYCADIEACAAQE